MGFPGGSATKKLPADEGDMDSISSSGRSPGEGNGNPLQYSCLGNPMDRGAWWAGYLMQQWSKGRLCDSGPTLSPSLLLGNLS